MRVRWVVVFLLVLAMQSGGPEAQEPGVVRASAASWEYGVLEYTYGNDGYVYLFCRATAAGCQEQHAEPETRSVRSIGQPERRFRYTSDPLAKVLTRLGRAGWELVGEARFGAGCGDDCRVLHFKRAVYVR
jgi:hypothetical protein